MAISRREFLKYTAVTGAALLFGVFDLNPVVARAQENPPVWTSEAVSVCGYCSVGCSMLVGKGTITGYPGDYVTYVQGNPDSPINEGALCSKGSASAQFSTIAVGYSAWQPGRAYRVGECVVPNYDPLTRKNLYVAWKYECTVAGTSDSAQPVWPTTIDATVTDGGVTWTCKASDAGARIPNPGRLTKVLKRLPNATTWTEIDWATANSEIAAKVKATRDAAFIETSSGITVNRCPNIATLGGSSLNNEAAYLIGKLNRGLGVVYLETQARN